MTRRRTIDQLRIEGLDYEAPRIMARFEHDTFYGEPVCIALDGRYYLMVEELSGNPAFREVSRQFFVAWAEEFAGNDPERPERPGTLAMEAVRMARGALGAKVCELEVRVAQMHGCGMFKNYLLEQVHALESVREFLGQFEHPKPAGVADAGA